MDQPDHKRKKKNVLTEGPISPEMIARSISAHQYKTTIGAHDIFLGQVRADVIDGRTVASIEYTAYNEMAEEAFGSLREQAFARFNLTCLHLYHSLGSVQAGQICLFVFASAPHRADALEACRFLVEEIKVKVPIFGKEVFDDGDHQWKMNR
jgi:molybdopterin synthase catalytic subunit